MSTLLINGKAVEGADLFAYDGCHKIYLITNDEGRQNVDGYDLYPVSLLPTIWEETCPLRFISPADLKGPDLIPQGQDGTIEYQEA